MKKNLALLSACLLITCSDVYPNSVPVWTDYMPLMKIQCVTVEGETVIISDKSVYAVFKAKDYKTFVGCVVDFNPPKKNASDADDEIKAEIERRVQESEYCTPGEDDEEQN
jgi:hypothetical protein